VMPPFDVAERPTAVSFLRLKIEVMWPS